MLSFSQNRAIGRIRSFLDAAKTLVDGDPSVPDVSIAGVVASANSAFTALESQITAVGASNVGSAITSTFDYVTNPTLRLKFLVMCLYGEVVGLSYQLPVFADEAALLLSLFYLLSSLV